MGAGACGLPRFMQKKHMNNQLGVYDAMNIVRSPGESCSN